MWEGEGEIVSPGNRFYVVARARSDPWFCGDQGPGDALIADAPLPRPVARQVWEQEHDLESDRAVELWKQAAQRTWIARPRQWLPAANGDLVGKGPWAWEVHRKKQMSLPPMPPDPSALVVRRRRLQRTWDMLRLLLRTYPQALERVVDERLREALQDPTMNSALKLEDAVFRDRTLQHVWSGDIPPVEEDGGGGGGGGGGDDDNSDDDGGGGGGGGDDDNSDGGGGEGEDDNGGDDSGDDDDDDDGSDGEEERGSNSSSDEEEEEEEKEEERGGGRKGKKSVMSSIAESVRNRKDRRRNTRYLSLQGGWVEEEEEEGAGWSPIFGPDGESFLPFVDAKVEGEEGAWPEMLAGGVDDVVEACRRWGYGSLDSETAALVLLGQPWLDSIHPRYAIFAIFVLSHSLSHEVVTGCVRALPAHLARCAGTTFEAAAMNAATYVMLRTLAMQTLGTSPEAAGREGEAYMDALCRLRGERLG